jgi:hypothetical protein
MSWASAVIYALARCPPGAAAPRLKFSIAFAAALASIINSALLVPEANTLRFPGYTVTEPPPKLPNPVIEYPPQALFESIVTEDSGTGFIPPRTPDDIIADAMDTAPLNLAVPPSYDAADILAVNHPVAAETVFILKYAVPATENIEALRVLIVIDACEGDIGKVPDDAVKDAIDTAPVNPPIPAFIEPICNEEYDPRTPYIEEIVMEACEVDIGKVPDDAVKDAIDTAPVNCAVPAFMESPLILAALTQVALTFVPFR